jgi:hypothetical protein
MVDKHSFILLVVGKWGMLNFYLQFYTLLTISYGSLIKTIEVYFTFLFYIGKRVYSIYYICDIAGGLKDNIILFDDVNGNNMLHFVGQLAPSNRLNTILGATLQMQ